MKKFFAYKLASYAFLGGFVFVANSASVFATEPMPSHLQSPDLKAVALRYDVKEPKKIDLAYDVYAGGFKALRADLELDLAQKAYDMELKTSTQGFIGGLFPWSATYNTSGHAENGKLLPTIHTAKSQWKQKVKLTEMTFDPKGNLLKTVVQDGEKNKVERDIKKELSQDAVDMLTGTLLMMQSTKNTEKCAGSYPVFDGKRRFNITLKDDGTELIKQTKFSTFSGKALKCTVKVEPVAGFNAKDQKRGWMAVQNHTEARHKPPTIWFAKVDDNKNTPVVPVRMEIASDYGSVVAHLTSKTEP